MQNYWIGIMALAFVIAMTLWLVLVFRADRHPEGKVQESWPRREIIGGEFEAREGGRQLMPHPAERSEPSPEPVGTADVPRSAVPEQARPGHDGAERQMPAVAEQQSAEVPEQSKAEMPERAPARGDRP